MNQSSSQPREAASRGIELQDGVETSKPVVLIVDDDATSRLALAAMIAPDEYHIVFATDAAELRRRLESIHPDVIVCDLVMEGMNGDEFIRWLQGHDLWRLVPVVGVTRLDNHIVRTDLMLAGADSVLSKPCNGAELRAHVRAALRTREKYKELECGIGTIP